nr:MDIS1-interacting receptor like kinase 2-like [Ipomoea batatas]
MYNMKSSSYPPKQSSSMENFGWKYVAALIFLVLPCFFALETTTSSARKEAEALLKWKSGLSMCNGSSFPLNSWSLSNLWNLCNWRGIVCNVGGSAVSEINLPNAHLCGNLHHLNFTSFPSLTGFNITGNRFNGSIPPAIGDLSDLVFLDLSFNRFGRSIPPQIGKLRELQYLSLSHNKFSGVVPHQIGNLQKVCFLDLGSNYYLEAPDWSTFKSTFPVLRHLSFHGNDWYRQSRFPDFILRSRNLTYLDFSENNFNGSILESLFNKLEKLEYLYLSDNQFSGPLPSNIGKLSNLKYIDLSDNYLNGSIPESLFNRLEKLEYLYLSDNQFSGPLPSNIGKLSNLKYLDLSGNNLNGSIPESLFTRLKKLEFLYLLCNNFSEPLSPNIGKLSNLKHLDLSGNNLNGSIPESLFNRLEKLEYLYLYDNQFSGPLPPNIGKLSNLKELDLKSNSLQGEIPSSIGQLKNLQVLSIVANELNSNIPSELGCCTNLAHLDLSSNSLFGPLPSSLSSLTKLSKLDLSYNVLSDLLADAMGLGKTVMTIALILARLGKGILDNQELAEDMAITRHSKNKRIKGDTLIVCPMALLGQWNDELEPHSKPDSIPVFVHYGGDKTLIFLVMPCFFALETIASTTTEAEALLKWKSSLSVFEGFSFPLDSWSLSNLRNMCNWRGIVCNGGGATTVSQINLPNAHLSGTLHHLNFTSFPSLTRFNISGNYFEGSIPPAIGDLSNLVFLDLSHNRFDGNIPPQIGNLTELQHFDLYGGNYMSGVIPHQFGNLQKVCFLDFGYSPSLDASDWSSKVKSYPMLRHFSFSRGELISFPDFILCSRNLTYLGLSGTNLNGSIPESLFTNLEKLEYLDLSDNEFSGPLSPNISNLSHLNDLILSGNQFQGEIPYSIGQLKNLQVFDVSYNLLNSAIPSSLLSLTKLSNLDLSSNFISGDISRYFISNWTKLTNLGLAYNSFHGSLPSEIGMMNNVFVSVLELSF